MNFTSVSWICLLAFAGCTKTSFLGARTGPSPQTQPPVATDSNVPTEGERRPDVSPPAQPTESKEIPPTQPWWYPTVKGQTYQPPVDTGSKLPTTTTQTKQPPVIVYKDEKLPDVIHLQAIRRNHEAWWKTCFFAQVTANGYTSQRVPLGCNKDTTPPTFIDLPAKKGACNLIWIQAETTRQVLGTCGAKPCEYDTSPDYYVSSVGAGYQKYFMFRGSDVKSVLGYAGFQRLLHLTATQQSELNEVVAGASAAKAAGQNWARIYYEDQSLTNVTKYVSAGDWQQSAWGALGIDYNDYVLDFVGDPGIAFQFTANVSQNIAHYYAGESPAVAYANRASFCE